MIFTKHIKKSPTKRNFILSQISILSISAQQKAKMFETLSRIVNINSNLSLFHRCSDDIIVTLVSLVTSIDSYVHMSLRSSKDVTDETDIFARVNNLICSPSTNVPSSY